MSVDGDRFLDPLVTSPPQLAATGPAHNLASVAQPRTHGKAIAAFVLAVSSVVVGWVPFLCVLAVVAAVLAIVFGFASLRRIRHEDHHDGHRRGRGLAMAAIFIAPVGFAVSGVGIWLTVLTVREFDKFSNVGEYSTQTTRCAVDSGVAFFDGTITNGSTSTRSYHVVVEFVRVGTSNGLYTTNVDVDGVQPGATSNWSVTQPVSEERLDCRISSVTGPLPFGES